MDSGFNQEYCEKCEDFRKQVNMFEQQIYARTEELCKYIHKYRRLKKIFIVLCAAYLGLVLAFMSITAKASEINCTRAKLSWNAPTTRVNGTSLKIEELDYYTIQVIDMSSGEVTTIEDYVYIENIKYVTDVYGNVVDKYWFQTKPVDQNLRSGPQCFRIKVTDVGGLESVWSDTVCKDMCELRNIDIEIGVTE